jgi:hypothetical protein
MSNQNLIRSIDPAALNKAADVIKVVGHPDRLRILEFLEDEESSLSTWPRCAGAESWKPGGMGPTSFTTSSNRR